MASYKLVPPRIPQPYQFFCETLRLLVKLLSRSNSNSLFKIEAPHMKSGNKFSISGPSVILKCIIEP